MIYYSTIPIEMAFYRPDELKLKQIQVDGVKMIVHEGEEGEATIVQVLSGDPGHFLILVFSRETPSKTFRP